MLSTACIPLWTNATGPSSTVLRGQPLVADWNGDLWPDLVLPASAGGTADPTTSLLLSDAQGAYSFASKYACGI